MLPYKQKMFRQKPYTQCFECIQGSRLKCKKCMAALINEVLEHRNKTQGNKVETKPCINYSKLYQMRHKRRDQTLQINTCYGLWMTQIRSRRKEQDDPLKSTLSNWPRKKVGNHQKNMKIEVPRFESWQKRLLARFSGIDQGSKSESKVHGLSMR